MVEAADQPPEDPEIRVRGRHDLAKAPHRLDDPGVKVLNQDEVVEWHALADGPEVAVLPPGGFAGADQLLDALAMVAEPQLAKSVSLQGDLAQPEPRQGAPAMLESFQDEESEQHLGQQEFPLDEAVRHPVLVLGLLVLLGRASQLRLDLERSAGSQDDPEVIQGVPVDALERLHADTESNEVPEETAGIGQEHREGIVPGLVGELGQVVEEFDSMAAVLHSGFQLTAPAETETAAQAEPSSEAKLFPESFRP